MTDTLPGFERPTAQASVSPRPEGRVVRVRPDITSITRSFDYVVPTEWEADGRADKISVGSLVRIDFHGRRTAGWVTEVDVIPDPELTLRPLSKWSSVGPPPDVIDLASWAANRWAGRLAHFLRVASPPRMVQTVRDPVDTSQVVAAEAHLDAFSAPLTLVRTTPHDDGVGFALAAASLGRALILVPTIAQRQSMTRALRGAGLFVAEYNDQWERSAAGAVTVGTSTAAFAPMPVLDAVLVVDEHDPAYKQERTPTWNARDVAIERARRSDAPCVLTSPAPSLESLVVADRQLVPERSAERNSWPLVDLVDLRNQERPGLLTDALVPIIRGEGPIACILNRKGRARMLACATCSSLAACTECGAAVREDDNKRLICPRDGTVRPLVCAECGGTHLKQLRLGITRMAEDLAVLAKREVLEVSAETPQQHLSGDRLFVGTEALLHRIDHARFVVFMDFDQELAFPRVRAAEEAFALLALAARRLGPRADGGKLMIQTHRPDDVVVQAALHGDPARVARAQREVRTVFKQPPYGAWALISGPGADTFVDGLSGIRKNKLGDRWRLSAPNHDTLLDAVNSGVRPPERTRIEIDPLDI